MLGEILRGHSNAAWRARGTKQRRLVPFAAFVAVGALFFGAVPAAAETTPTDSAIQTVESAETPVATEPSAPTEPPAPSESPDGDAGPTEVGDDSAVHTDQGDVDLPGVFDHDTPDREPGNVGQRADISDAPVAAVTPFADTTFVCSAERVYTLHRPSSGTRSEVRLVNTQTGATSAGVSFTQRNTNGLAMSGDGTTAYAILQGAPNPGSLTDAQTNIYSVTAAGATATVATGLTLTRTSGRTTYSINRSALVAGAINPVNGYFYFGGYGTSGTGLAEFFMYAYDLVNNSYQGMVGRVTIAGSVGSYIANGDMAFDAQGNLYILWSGVNGGGANSPVTNQLVRVGAASVPSTASTSTVASTAVVAPASATDGSGYNGATFDANGSLILQKYNANIATGAVSTMLTTDPNTGSTTNTTSMSPTSYLFTDLASCAYPPTLQLKKIVNGRVAGTDQFRLQIRQQNVTTLLADETTTGPPTGLQNEVAGPVIAVPGRVYTISELGAGTASLTNYATTYVCVWGSETTPFASGTLTGTTRTATLPAIPTNRSGQSLTCTMTNTPLVTPVVVKKTVLDAQGQNPQPGVGWTVGAASAATAGTVTATPSAVTATTNAAGQVSWSLLFSATTARATVTVSETQQPTYEFVSGTCTVTPLTGQPRVVTLTSEAATAVTGVAPGDSVACEYVNKLKPTRLTLVKQVTGGTAAPTSWALTATAPANALPGPSGITGTPQATAPITPNVAYALSENSPAGLDRYVSQGWACVDENNAPVAVTGSAVTLTRVGADVTCTVTNTTATLTLLKKVGDGLNVPASAFTLTGTPASGHTLATVTTPGAAAPAASNTFEIRPDHTYTLSEASTSTTLAYRNTHLQILAPGTDPAVEANWSDVASFDIQVAPNAHATYRFVNDAVPAVVLPLTGGLSTDAFLIVGGIVLAGAFVLASVHAHRRRRRTMT